MGAWSEDNFGNDDASDWIYDLEESKGTSVLMAPIRKVNGSEEYMESPDCSEALAASEVIAAALTGDYSIVPESVPKWLNAKKGLFRKKPVVDRSFAQEAVSAVEKIVSDSELKELWEETEFFENWQRIQIALIDKLKGV